MTRTLEEQGFTKHDGSGMPDCYQPDDLVDVVKVGIGQKDYPVACNNLSWASANNGFPITHHRRHISERQQLDMAIEALRMFIGSAFPVSSEINERQYNWCEAYLDEALPEATATLKTLKERQP